jgi:hypothetical protein
VNTHPPALAHLPPREIFPGVWLAASTISMGIPLGLRIRFSRNMIAVRGADGWVLFNPVRLSEAAEAGLLAVAPFRHAVRLGAFHGRDDQYYVDKFGTEFWAARGRHAYEGPRITHEITEDGPLPLPGARVVTFRSGKLAECVVCLPQHRLLLTCDSVQHYENDPQLSLLARLVMRPLGFFTPCVIGPFWLKATTPPGGSLRADFERVLAHLISGHGTLKKGGAKAALARNVQRLP